MTEGFEKIKDNLVESAQLPPVKLLKIYSRLALWILVNFTPIVSIAEAKAQIIPDRTLGAESSVVTPHVNINGIPTDRIDGGAIRGNNLFHSFQDFNINRGRGVYFANPSRIQNILSRVTGSSRSNILGTLGVLGNANLFLLNPNGIVFGPEARLDMRGSFIGSSADSILWENGLEFSATNPEAPPLLTINIPIGLNFRETPGEIRVEGTGNSDIFPNESSSSLAVMPGQTLALVGGNVTFADGILTAPSARLEIGSVEKGTVSLNPSLSGWELGYETVEAFGDIQLLETSSLWNPNIIFNPLAGIFVNGGNVRLEGRSQLASVTLGETPGGNIVLNAVESLEIGGVDETIFPYSSWIVNQVAPQATGNSGNIIVTAPQLTISDGGRIQTISLGAGAAGKVEVNADTISLNGFSPLSNILEPGFANALHSRISSENYSTGPGGTVDISTRELNMLDGGLVLSLAGPEATAPGGTIIVRVSESITGMGVNPNNPINGIASISFGMGDGGDIQVSAQRLTLSDGAQINSTVTGSGTGGDVAVNASESIAAMGINRFFPVGVSGIFGLTVGPADSGEISISAPRLRLTDGGSVRSASFVELLGDPVPGAGMGNAGDIEVVASLVELIGTSVLAPENQSSLTSVTFGSGDAGNVSISTRKLTIQDGASLSSAVLLGVAISEELLLGSGTGKGGNLTVNATESIEVIGRGIGTAGPSDLATGTLGTGSAGDTLINTQRLTVADGGLITAETSSIGNAGRLTINATKQIIVSGIAANGVPTRVSANARSVVEDIQDAFFLPELPSGNTGELTINTPRLIVENGARLTVGHEGEEGNAGTMQLNVSEIVLDRGGRIAAETRSGQGGNAILNVADSLQLRNGSAIAVEARGSQGNGGNLTINADTITSLSGSNITANAIGGNGGNINITASGLFVSTDSAITASSRQREDGIVAINTPETDPTSGWLTLPDNLQDAAALIATRPCAQTGDSSFAIAQRGGLAANPSHPLDSDLAMVNLVEPVSGTPPNFDSQPQIVSSTSPLPIVPARGWIFSEDGSVQLVAYPTNSATSRVLPEHLSCHSTDRRN